MLGFIKQQIVCMPIDGVEFYKKGCLFARLQKALLYCYNSLAVVFSYLMHYHLLSID